MTLDRDFYGRPVHDVARDLIGCVIRHGEAAGRIVETESYHMEEPACHAYAGVTERHAGSSSSTFRACASWSRTRGSAVPPSETFDSSQAPCASSS